MSFAPSFHDNQPITWFRRVPIYATTVFTALFVLGLIVSVVLASAHVPVPLAFIPPQFLHGYVWQIFTYPFLGLPNFFTALGILCFYSWALEIEKYIGRGQFLTLLGLFVFAESLTCLLWWWTEDFPAMAGGNYHITAALLIGFATLYPGIEYFGWIPLKWFAFVCLALGTLMYLPERDWRGVTQLWATCGVAFGYIRFLQRGGAESFRLALPRLNLFRRQPKFRVVPAARTVFPSSEESETTADVDALLDKIAKSGMASLTSKERARLEKARADLMRKDQR
jgi:hypothetical protein